MAIQKTTLKRYNGTDWDAIYLASSADIIGLGSAHQVSTATADGFTDGQNLPAGTLVETLLTQIINNLTKLDKVTVPALADGTGATSVPAEKITGTIKLENLPNDVKFTTVEVANRAARLLLTKEQVQNGDVVKQKDDGSLYFVKDDTSLTGDAGYELISTASIAWSKVTGTPTTLAGYGITDAVNASDVVDAAAANKILRLNGDGKLAADITGDAATLGGQAPTYYATEADLTAAEGRLDAVEPKVTQLETDVKNIDCAWLTTGTISVDRLPQAALERLYVAEDDAARLLLTKEQVQNGDVVKVTDTGLMYYIKDDTKLSSDGVASAQEAAFEPFTAGAASSVPWSGVTSKPTTIDGYGITDAVKANEKTATYVESGVVIWATGNTEGRSWEINGKAKSAADADLAANATQFGGHAVSYFATATDMTAASEYIASLKDGSVSELVVPVSKLNGVIDMANLPNEVKFELVAVADQTARYELTTATVQKGDVVKQNDTGALYIVKDVSQLGSEAGYEMITSPSIAWSKITGTPTTLAGYGITDAVAASSVTTTYTASGVVGWQQGTNGTTTTQYDINGKANTACLADQASDASKLGGQAPTYYATATDMTAVEGRLDTVEGQIGDGSDSGILYEISQLKSGETITTISAEKISGIIPVENLPQAALERLYVASTAADLATLTTEQVQNGDTIKVQDSGLMYFVKDETKLNTGDYMQGLEPYTVGQASQVPWSGVTGKPTTLAGYGITDAVAANEKVTVANAGNAGKILVLNAEGKLDVDITGSVMWDKILNKPTSSVEQIDQAVTAATHANRTVLDALSDNSGTLQYKGKDLATAESVTALANRVSALELAPLKIVSDVSTEYPDAAVGQLALEVIS